MNYRLKNQIVASRRLDESFKKLCKKGIVACTVILAFIHCGVKPPTSISKKPNIILLLTDDQTYTAINALGNSEIITPNMDRLVSMGTSFSNAHNMGAWNGAVCVASRAMIISGRAVWQAKNISDDWKKNDSIAKTWVKLMESAGYETYMTGKWHVDADAAKVFKHVKNVRPGMAEDKWDSKFINKNREAINTGKLNADAFMPPGYNRPKNADDTAWRSYNSDIAGYWKGGEHWSKVLADDAINFIETASKDARPFFMYIASNAPHDPRQAPKKYWDLYPLDKISLPKSWMPVYPYKDAIDNGPTLRDEALAPFPRTEYAIKSHIREYYASITYLDEQIGRILTALESARKLNDTYIMFTSDHGLAIGKHGLMGKQSLFEHSVKPPLIIAGPGIRKNARVDAQVYMQDLMATSLELGGVKKPPYVFFNSLLGLARGTTSKSKYPAIYGSYINVERSIHKGNFKLIVYPKIKKTLLFDLKNDPEEMNDLADQKGYKKKIISLFGDLIALQQSLKDPLDLHVWYQDLKTKIK